MRPPCAPLLAVDAGAQHPAGAVDAHDPTAVRRRRHDEDVEPMAARRRRPDRVDAPARRVRRKRRCAALDGLDVQAARLSRDRRIVDLPMEDRDDPGRRLQQPEDDGGETQASGERRRSGRAASCPSPERGAEPLRALGERAIGEWREDHRFEERMGSTAIDLHPGGHSGRRRRSLRPGALLGQQVELRSNQQDLRQAREIGERGQARGSRASASSRR